MARVRVGFGKASPLAILMGLLALSTPSARAEAPGRSAPPPIPPVLSVTELGSVAQNPVIEGRDGTWSALVGGRSIWTFGDTVLSVPGESGDGWDNNTLSWTTDLSASDGIGLDHDLLDSTGAPAEFIPYLDWERVYDERHDPQHCTADPCGAEFAMWGGPVVNDPVRHRVLYVYDEIWRVAGQFGWRNVGTGIAVGTPDGTITRPIEDPSSPTPTLMWGEHETGFAGGSVVVGSTLYSYGCEPGFFVQHCEVARVPLSQALNKSQWRYYAGAGVWSASEADAVAVFDGGAAGNSVFLDPYLGDYVAIYSGVFSNDVYYRVAYQPWGPWSNQALLFTGRSGWHGTAVYAGMAHPELGEGNGQTEYVTYVHASGLFQSNLPLVQVVFGLPSH